MSVYVENKRARFDYEILETLEAGLVLSGFETKSIRKGRMDLTDSYVRTNQQGEAILLNSKIHPFQPGNTPKNYEISRSRKLLLKKRELKNLLGKLQEKKLTAVPLKVYTSGDLIKMSLGIAKSKREFQKRELLRKKAIDREVERTLTN